MSGLSRFRTDAPVEQASPIAAHLIGISPIWHGNFLAFDQSLSNTGYVHGWVMDGKMHVATTGNLKPPDFGVKGIKQTMLTATWLAINIAEIINRINPMLVIHEEPATFGKRTDASLVAATVVRAVAEIVLPGKPVVMIAAQKAKTRVAGKRDATKAQVADGVKRLLPTLAHDLKASKQPLNQAITDALAVAIVAVESMRSS